MERKWLIGLPIIVMVGVSALFIGLVPGVRGWLDLAFPQLGINGPSETRSNQANTRGQVAPLTTPSLDELAPIIDQPNSGSPGPLVSLEGTSPYPQSNAPVQFAQATLPIAQTQLSGNRFSQNPGSTLQVPNSGIAVPSSSANGSLIVESAQVFFYQDIFVAAQSDGLITELFVDDGSFVKKGEPIIVLDSRLAEADAEVAKEELAAAESKAKDNSSIEYATAAVEVALKDVQMSNELYSKGAEGVMENEKKQLELKKARLQVNVSKNEKAQQENAVGVQKAKLNAATVQLALRKIPAPWDGFVTEVDKRQFSYVRAGEKILRFTSMKNIRVKGPAKVSDSPNLLLNAPARVTIYVAEGKPMPPITCTVTAIAPRSVTADEYPIFVDIPNQLAADGQYLFREGMKATIEIQPPR